MKSRIFAALIAAAALPVAAQTASAARVDPQGQDKVQKVEKKALPDSKIGPKDCARLEKARNKQVKKDAKKKSNPKTAA